LKRLVPLNVFIFKLLFSTSKHSFASKIFFCFFIHFGLFFQTGELQLTSADNTGNINIGFIFQVFNLLPVYTVYENVELPLILNNVEKTDRVKKVTQAIEWVGLQDKINSKPAQMSGGECQRTAIARAIVHEPALLLADEPTANLDAENSHNIMKILSKLNTEMSTSFVFATHDEKIMGYLKRIIHLEDGKILNDKKISIPKFS